MLLKEWRADQRQDNPGAAEQVRISLRDLERQFEDLFDELDRLVREMAGAYERRPDVPAMRDSPFRLGSTIVLDAIEFNKILPMLQRIGQLAAQTRAQAITVQQQLVHSKAPFEARIEFGGIGRLNDDLNEVLFDSKTVGEALEKLRLAKQRADGFIAAVKSAIRGN